VLLIYHKFTRFLLNFLNDLLVVYILLEVFVSFFGIQTPYPGPRAQSLFLALGALVLPGVNF